MDSHPDSNRAADAKAGRAATHEMPRWVKLFGAVAALGVVVFGILHAAGGGKGHIAHDLTHEHTGGEIPDKHGHHLQ